MSGTASATAEKKTGERLRPNETRGLKGEGVLIDANYVKG